MRVVLQPPRPNPCVGETSTNPDTERIGTPLVIRCSYTLEGRSCALGTGYAQLYDSANPAASPLDLVHVLARPPFPRLRGTRRFHGITTHLVRINSLCRQTAHTVIR